MGERRMINPPLKVLHFNLESSPIEPGLISNYGEFAIIKIRVLHLFPDSYIFKCVTVSRPVRNKKITVLGSQHIRQANIVFAIYFYYVDFGVLYYNFCHEILKYLVFSAQNYT